MKEIILVFVGGGLGSSLRLLINKLIPSDTFPYSTLTVNLIGSFLIGFIISYLLHEFQVSKWHEENIITQFKKNNLTYFINALYDCLSSVLWQK